MKIVSVTLNRSEQGGYEWWKSNQLDCPPCFYGFWRVIRKYFYLPQKTEDRVKHVHLSLHTHPSKWRVPVPILQEQTTNKEMVPYLIFDDTFDSYCDINLDDVLKPYNGKTVYLEMEYTI